MHMFVSMYASVYAHHTYAHTCKFKKEPTFQKAILGNKHEMHIETKM